MKGGREEGGRGRERVKKKDRGGRRERRREEG